MCRLTSCITSLFKLNFVYRPLTTLDPSFLATHMKGGSDPVIDSVTVKA